MPPRKRAAASSSTVEEPVPKRRSLRHAPKTGGNYRESSEEPIEKPKSVSKRGSTKKSLKEDEVKKPATQKVEKLARQSSTRKTKKPAALKKAIPDSAPEAKQNDTSSRAVSEDPDVDSIPTTNPNAQRHEGEWYWLMKAEPETRYENGIDVRFSVDDLRAKEKPEGWDGIRNYAARNHMRNMNAGDKAFFYHSNCKEPGIVGIMEIVKEFSQDKSALRPGTPYYDPKATKDNPKWDLVHVEFRKKFAVQIGLKELKELGKPGGPLETMQMLKQSRLSVSRVSADEWKALCKIADQKAKEAGLEHEE